MNSIFMHEPSHMYNFCGLVFAVAAAFVIPDDDVIVQCYFLAYLLFSKKKKDTPRIVASTNVALFHQNEMNTAILLRLCD